MPRIPRLRKGAPDAPQAPEAPTVQTTETTSGDPLASPDPSAPGTSEANGESAVTPPHGDPLTTAATSGDPIGGPPTAPASGDPLAGPPTPATSDRLAGPPTPATSDPLGQQPAPPPGEAATAVLPAVETPPGQDSAEIVEEAPADAAPGFRERARMRRRLRYLRRYRELAFRDLGGLTFDLHRFGRDRGDLITQKLEGLATVDTELRALETALRERRDMTELREAGIAACPRCATLHDTDANFCPGCGTALRGAVVRDAAPVSVSVAPAANEPPATGTPTAPAVTEQQKADAPS